MGVGPAYAIPKVLAKTGLSKDDVDFYEINEAFASQAVYSINKIGIPYGRVNVNGGAIAIGHPLGCSALILSFGHHQCSHSLRCTSAGARQIATGLNIAKQRNERIFVTSMCIGSGMGMAAVFVSEH